jgi:hypothetical protein
MPRQQQPVSTSPAIETRCVHGGHTPDLDAVLEVA